MLMEDNTFQFLNHWLKWKQCMIKKLKKARPKVGLLSGETWIWKKRD